ncbi:glycosyltransferase family 2 protein [Rufibacter psychrotolerans]|uniref:glycosyltransferase family 2 protein n=1 Tax=Rufibacter psychrotolerans TaxID=2812556 RepID=UPI001968139E|nr:glycosyltransferase family 2 protein [Rufibacter sp. SYSU D00308]
MSSLVYIVIVNYKRWTDTMECLESLLRSTYSHFRVVVIDNDSQNNSVQHLADWAAGKQAFTCPNPRLQHLFSSPRKQELTFCTLTEEELEAVDVSAPAPLLTLVQARNNHGFAAGNNLFLKKLLTTESYVWMLNPDMVVEEDTLRHLVACAQHQPAKVILGSRVKSYEAPTHTLNLGAGKINSYTGTVSMVHSASEQAEIDYISGGALFTSAASFRDLGLMEESFFLYWEETEWCYRAKRQGYRLQVCEDAVVYDKISTSIGRGYLAEYYYTLNALRFTHRNLRGKVPFVVASNLIRVAKRTALFKFDRAKAVVMATRDFLFNGKPGVARP